MSQSRPRLVCPCGEPVAQPRQPRDSADPNSLWPARVATCPKCKRLLIAEDPNVGRVIGNKWKLERRLGQGGMGSVYLAADLTIEREVALKFLHPRLVERDEYRSRFEREAKVMGRVDHPNLARLYGVERIGSTPFLVMKFVPGTTLTRVMKLRQRLPLSETLDVVRQIGAGLGALHAQGLVHRDLKPGNVIVDDRGHVTLLDFGLTRSNDGSLTRPGVAMGSPHFMSPEQVTGGTLDGRSDLYSLGLLTSELLTGRRPYPDASTQLMLLQHLNESPVPVNVSNPALPEEVAQVILVALAKKPNERQRSVQAFVEDFIAATEGRSTVTSLIFSEVLPAPDGQRVAEEVNRQTASLASSEQVEPLETVVARGPSVAPAEPKETVLARAPAFETEPMPAWEERTEDLAGKQTEAVNAWNDVTEPPNEQQRTVVEEARRRHRQAQLRTLLLAGLVVVLLAITAVGLWLLLR